MIYLGFAFAPVPNWDTIMPIKAPSNYKKPEAIEKYIATRKAELESGKAAIDMLVGQVTSVAVHNTDGAPCAVCAGKDMIGVFKNVIEETTKGISAVGWKIHRGLKLLAQTAALSGDVIPVNHFKWIDEMYNRLGGFIDPVSLLFGTSDIDINAVAARTGLPINPDDPKALVEFAKLLTKGVDVGG